MSWKNILKDDSDINWEETTGYSREFWKYAMRETFEEWLRVIRKDIEYAGNHFNPELETQMGELIKKAIEHKSKNEIYEFAVIVYFIEQEIAPELDKAVSQKQREEGTGNWRTRRRRR